MGFSYITYYLKEYEYYDCRTEGEGDVWEQHPTPKGTIIYSVITPILCFFGICGNTLSILVLMRRELSGSVYTYLAVLAITDLISSLLLFLGGLSKGVFWYDGWAVYDAMIGLPLGGAVNFLGVCATVFVTIDRVTYITNTKICQKPKFCNSGFARKSMFICFLISLLCNIPYCFVFDRGDDGKIVTTDFFNTTIYKVHNWICFILFCIIPSIILIVGNGILINSLNKASRLRTKLNSKSKKLESKSITLVLIVIIIMFLVSEIPSNLISRTSAVTLLYRGDPGSVNDKAMEIARQVVTVIGAISITINFVVYYLFCPPFYKVLVKMFKRKEKRMSKTVVNVFVLNGDGDKRKCSVVMNDKVIRLSSKNIDDYLPSVLFRNDDSMEDNSECKKTDTKNTTDTHY